MARSGLRRADNTSTKKTNVHLNPVTEAKLPPPVLDSKTFPIVEPSKLPPEYNKMVAALPGSYKYRVYDLSKLEDKKFVDFTRTREQKRGHSTRSEVLAHGTNIEVMKQILSLNWISEGSDKKRKGIQDGIYLTSKMLYAWITQRKIMNVGSFCCVTCWLGTG